MRFFTVKEATMLRPTPTHMEAERDENGGDNMSAPQVDVNGEAAGRDPNSEAAAAAEESNDKVIYGKRLRDHQNVLNRLD